MTFFETIEPLTARVMQDPHAMPVINEIARRRVKLLPDPSGSDLAHAMGVADITVRRATTPLIDAGYIDAAPVGSSGVYRLSLTDAGWAISDYDRPFWEAE